MGGSIKAIIDIYFHDADGQVSSITINDQPPIRLERDAAGQITAEQLGGHLRRTYGYDEEGRRVHMHAASGLEQIERSYQYDPAGNLIVKQDSRNGTWRYSHDPMGRIIEATDPLRQVRHYTHDPAGDLLKHLPDTKKGLRSATYNGHTYRFDAAGNLWEREQSGQCTRFQWDENNRLRTARTPQGATVQMAYDAIGRRIRKSVDGERTFFTWDGDALLAEKHEDQPAREYIYYPGTFEPLALIDTDGRLYYYHNDINGMPRELTKPNGDIVWSADYDALGRVEELLVDEVAQPLRLQGQYYDAEIDLCYNRYRYFDPQICSFISQDPIGFAGGENVYAYAPNVWGWVDPLGLFGFGTPKSKYKGHSDFSGYNPDFFDYNLEDTDKTTSPYRRPERHFRPLEISEKQVMKAIDAGDNVEFARAMHRGQDYFSHYSKGYRWKPFRHRKNLGFGHMFDGTEPDQDINAWNKAEEWTKKWVGKWNEKNSSLKCG